VRELRFSHTARAQLGAIARYLYAKTGDAHVGGRLVREIEAHLLRIAELPPQMGRPRPDLGRDIRSVPHRSYMLFIRYSENHIDVVQVLHGRRNIPAQSKD
jgi:toxin ParE1/3/4